ncbi:efflux RND transporter periplasmic adaptor subunit [Paraburkholderia sp. Ac-20347]|uniref:efflux RND transporter periplasmic adaptor subunit n=1 Tax=Paraburkholderia sp. Ac-20347 TaxID=2703892 RepID=UPI00197F6A14|nr:efflux RND transporter periplasmic adaptor subunit [Paraburkholderia sp. Ac-20347]MBN3812790.1 efflux RND transporter periplasmic adaptor subunit [Paraburkholderia sp. Ac-20347]
MIALVSIAGGYFYVSHRVAKPAFRYLTIPVTRGAIADVVLATGTIDSSNVVNVGAQVSGEIKTMGVTLGDRVKKGEMIAEIDSATQIDALNTARATLASLDGQIASETATLEQDRIAFDRTRRLAGSDAGSQQDMDNARLVYKAAQGTLRSLQEQRIVDQIAVNTAQVSLGYTKIRAPSEGVVVAVLSVRGQTVNANQETPNIVMLADPNKLIVRTAVSEIDVRKVRLGQKVSIVLLGGGREYHGTVRSVAPAPRDFDTQSSLSSQKQPSAVTFDVVIGVDDPDTQLRLGTTARVSMRVASASDAIALPSELVNVLPGGQKGFVQVLDHGKPQLREVTIGIDNGNVIQILDGLRPDARVVTKVELAGAPSTPKGR